MTKKELQRELQKYKKSLEHSTTSPNTVSRQHCSQCMSIMSSGEANNVPLSNGFEENGTMLTAKQHRTHSRTSSQSSQPSASRRPSETSESETMASSVTTIQQDLQVSRII